MKKHQDKSVFTGTTILYLNRHQTQEWKGWGKVCIWMTSRSQMKSSGGAGSSVCSASHHVLQSPSCVVLWVMMVLLALPFGDLDECISVQVSFRGDYVQYSAQML
ncbi:hypothetical protein Ancab_011120 [Ancistrocladus abbreviatus]